MRRITVGILTVVLLILLGWAASLVGGVGIRRVQPTEERIALQLTSPVVPGVPLLVRWNIPPLEGSRTITFFERSGTVMMPIGSGNLLDGSAFITFPCTISSSTGLIMEDASSGEVLSSRTVSALPAGPDCVVH